MVTPAAEPTAAVAHPTSVVPPTVTVTGAPIPALPGAALAAVRALAAVSIPATGAAASQDSASDKESNKPANEQVIKGRTRRKNYTVTGAVNQGTSRWTAKRSYVIYASSRNMFQGSARCSWLLNRWLRSMVFVTVN